MNLTFDSSRHHYAFGLHDRVIIENVAWRPVSSNEIGWVFSRPEEATICHQFTHEELSRLGSSGRIQTERDYFTVKAARRRVADTERLISILNENQQEKLFARQVWVRAFHDLERQRTVKRTDDSIVANLDALTLEALKLAQFLRGQNPSHASAAFQFRKAPSPRTLREWMKIYESDGLAALTDRAHLRGNRNRLLCNTAISWMMDAVRGYMHPDRPTVVTIVNRVKEIFAERNAERRAQGLPEVTPPSRETVRRAVLSLDPFQVEYHRMGAAAARKKFAPVGKGLEVTRPLERVEIDECVVDLVGLFAEMGLLEWFSEDERKALGLAGGKVRWTITVAICAATRCILAMVMTPSAKASAAVQAIKMILSDKGQLSTAVKAHGGWHMHGIPVELVTDNGAAFHSQEFQTVCADLGISALRTFAGVPEQRGRGRVSEVVEI